jgi:hypothetical protein
VLPGPDQIIACPKCGVLARVSSLLSGNTIGAQWWTDGKMVAPMLPETPEITRCRACAAFYWIADTQVIGEIYEFCLSDPKPRRRVPKKWRDAEEIRELSEEDYFQALAEGLGTPRERELYLRTRAWWAGNDRYRSEDPGEDPCKAAQPASSRSPEATANLERLFKLLRTSDVDERVMKGEAARQLGRFQEAWHILEFAFPKKYLRVAAFLRDLIHNRDMIVRPFPQEGPRSVHDES